MENDKFLDVRNVNGIVIIIRDGGGEVNCLLIRFMSVMYFDIIFDLDVRVLFYIYICFMKIVWVSCIIMLFFFFLFCLSNLFS